MTKNELISDMNFRQKCLDYGLYWKNFSIYNDTIILNSRKNNIFVLLDEHYNTIGIPKVEHYSSARTIQDYVISYKALYGFVDQEDGISFLYPFQNFSLKQIVELSNRISIYETNHGHSFDMIVNGEMVNDEYNSVYISLLLYIKFLGEQINEYFMNLYQMRMMGFEYPDVYTYIKSLMYNINEFINMDKEKHDKPAPIEIIEYLGQDRKKIDNYYFELNGIIDLLCKEKGSDDLSNKANELLKILEVTDEEVESRCEESNRTFSIKKINLESWLTKNRDKGPVLAKSTTSLK